MRKLMALTIFLIALWSLPSYAQTGTCIIDLSSAAATLVQAQAQASSGDNPAALAKLRELQAQIDVIIANCEGTTTTSANIPTPTEAVALLTNTPQPSPTIPATASQFTSASGLLTFTLPAGWQTFERGNSVFIGTSLDTANAVSEFRAPIGNELGAGFIIGTPQELAPTLREGANFVDVLVAYRSQLTLNGFTTSDDLTPTTWNDNPSGRFVFLSQTLAGIIQVVDLQNNNAHLLIFVASNPDMTGELEVFLTELLESIEINL